MLLARAEPPPPELMEALRARRGREEPGWVRAGRIGGDRWLVYDDYRQEVWIWSGGVLYPQPDGLVFGGRRGG